VVAERPLEPAQVAACPVAAERDHRAARVEIDEVRAERDRDAVETPRAAREQAERDLVRDVEAVLRGEDLEPDPRVLPDEEWPAAAAGHRDLAVGPVEVLRGDLDRHAGLELDPMCREPPVARE